MRVRPSNFVRTEADTILYSVRVVSDSATSTGAPSRPHLCNCRESICDIVNAIVTTQMICANPFPEPPKPQFRARLWGLNRTQYR